MSRVAIFASTVAAAVHLAQSDRTPETTRQAFSVAAVAYDFASAEGRQLLEVELRAKDLVGPGPGQFPGSPWVLWDEQRIFHLLKSSGLQHEAASALRGLTSDQLWNLSPATILAFLGAPHRPLRAPSWGMAALTALAVGSSAFIAYREWRSAQGGAWPA